MKKMTTTELVTLLSQTMNASETKEVQIIATNSLGQEVTLRASGVLEFKNAPGVVFIRGEAIGL